MRRFKNTAILLIVVSSWCWLANFSGAEEKYYMVVFSAQAAPVRGRNAHTFATFVRVADDAISDNGPKVERHTISWLPSTLQVRVLRRFPESGVNLGFQSTMDWARRRDARVTAWGPVQIQKELYDRALRQIDRLNSGAIAYKAIDRRYRGEAVNCIHAVADIDTDRGILSVGDAFGEAASSAVARHFQRWMVQPEDSSMWLAERLGLPEHGVQFASLPARVNGAE
jgi:hypothetical protein